VLADVHRVHSIDYISKPSIHMGFGQVLAWNLRLVLLIFPPFHVFFSSLYVYSKF